MAANVALVQEMGSPEAGTDSHPNPHRFPVTGLELVGRRIRRTFDAGWFEGEIKSYDAVARFYLVHYSDGDEEDLEEEEIQPLLVEPRRRPTRDTNTTAVRGECAESPGEGGGQKNRGKGSDSDWVQVANPGWLPGRQTGWQTMQKTGESGKPHEVLTVGNTKPIPESESVR